MRVLRQRTRPRCGPDARARCATELLSDERGAVLAELLLVYLPVLLAFFSFWQLSELLVGQLVVKRAASAAGRAAAVVLADDPAFYEGDNSEAFAGLRRRDIELAAGLVLATSPHFTSSFTVSVDATPGGFEPLRVSVAAEFRCGALSAFCGTGSRRILRSEATHVRHGADYSYALSVGDVGLTGDCAAQPGSGGRSGEPSRALRGSGGGGNEGTGGAETRVAGAGASGGRTEPGEPSSSGGRGGQCPGPRRPRVNDQDSSSNCVFCSIAALDDTTVTSLIRNRGLQQDRLGEYPAAIPGLLSGAGLIGRGRTTNAATFDDDDTGCAGRLCSKPGARRPSPNKGSAARALRFMKRTRENTFVVIYWPWTQNGFVHSVTAVRGADGTITFIDFQRSPPRHSTRLPSQTSRVVVYPVAVDWRTNGTMSDGFTCGIAVDNMFDTVNPYAR